MSYSPAIATGDVLHDYASERDALFGMIFRLQKQIEILNAKLEAVEGAGEASPVPICRSVETVEPSEETTRSIVRFEPFSSPVVSTRPSQAVAPTTLEETEKETIRRSLERNGGRRKAAARELNISERTLYRKIKEYGIE